MNYYTLNLAPNGQMLRALALQAAIANRNSDTNILESAEKYYEWMIGY